MKEGEGKGKGEEEGMKVTSLLFHPLFATAWVERDYEPV